jgi:hypothetical protein
MSPGIKPAGFIFHTSRCGSTLACRTLGALDRNLTLSEPWALEVVLRAHLRVAGITEQMRLDWLSWIVSALAQPRPGVDRLFIKFDAWGIAELPAIQRVFPDTPWIFLYRDPLEILVSQVLRPSTWGFPGVLHPALTNIPPEEASKMDPEEYCARVLARVCDFGIFHATRRRGLLVNYDEMPSAMWSRVATHFGLNFDSGEIAKMKDAALFDAKHPRVKFEADGEDKRALASERLRELAARWIEPMYYRLEQERANQAVAVDFASVTKDFNHPV